MPRAAHLRRRPASALSVVALSLAALGPTVAACGDDPPIEPAPTVEAVEVCPSRAVVSELDATVTLEPVALDVEDDELAGQSTDFTWRTTNPMVATVDAGGRATDRSTGQVTIIAELDRATGHAVVTVNQPATPPVTRWERPASSSSERLKDVWGSAPDIVWAVGFDGTILHFDGVEWSEAGIPTELDLQGVWGTGPEDVWAMGFHGTILHFDGTEWTEDSSPTEQDLQSVWGSGPGNVWAVGFLGTILQYDGTSWTPASDPPQKRPIDVRGSGPNDVWAEAVPGRTFQYDGTAWREMPNPSDGTHSGVWDMTPGDLWAVGLDGEILRGMR